VLRASIEGLPRSQGFIDLHPDICWATLTGSFYAAPVTMTENSWIPATSRKSLAFLVTKTRWGRRGGNLLVRHAASDRVHLEALLFQVRAKGVEASPMMRTPRVFVIWVYAWLTGSEAPRKTHSQRVSGSGVTAPIKTSAESSLPSDVMPTSGQASARLHDLIGPDLGQFGPIL
jgi:hypothetical protein